MHGRRRVELDHVPPGDATLNALVPSERNAHLCGSAHNCLRMPRLVWMLLFLSLVAALKGQPLQGVIYDQQQRGIAGAQLRRLGSWPVTRTDSSGRYRWADLPPGTHRFLITAEGYLPTIRSAYLADSVPTILNVGLHPAPATLLGPYLGPDQLPPLDPMDWPAALYSLPDFLGSPPPGPVLPPTLRVLPGTWLLQPSPGLGQWVIRGLPEQNLTLMLDGIRLDHSALGPDEASVSGLIDPWLLQGASLMPTGPLPQSLGEGLGGSLAWQSRRLAYRERGVAWGGSGRGQGRAPGLIRQGRFETHFASQRLTLLMGLSVHQAADRLAGGDSLLLPSAFRSQSLDFKLTQRLGQRSELILVHQQGQQPDLPHYDRQRWLGDSVATFPQRQRSFSYLRWIHRSSKPWWQHLALTTSLQRLSTEERRSGDAHSSAVMLSRRLLSVGFTARLLSRPKPGWEVYTGLACFRDLANGQADMLIDSLIPDHKLSSPWAAGGSATLGWVFQQHVWRRGKWQHSARAQVQAADLSLGNATFGDQQRRAVLFTGTLGSVYRLATQRRIFAQLHAGAQLPRLYELSQLGPQGERMVVPHETRRHARSATLSLGFRQRSERWTLSSSLFGRYSWALPALQPTLYRDSTQYRGLSAFQWQPSGQRRSLGGEAAWEWQRGNWSCFGHLSYVLAQTGSGQWVRRLPPLHGRLNLRYAPDGVWAQATISGAAPQSRLAPDDQRDPRIPSGGTAAWAQIDLSLGYRWDWGQVSVQGLNLLDAFILPHGSGIPLYGRRGAVGLEAWF